MEKEAFVSAYNNTAGRFGVGWNLTMGLYWIRPWFFSPLDSQSRNYIEKGLCLTIPQNGPKGKCSGQDYLKLLDMLNARFREETFPVHSFPDMSLKAWIYKDDSSDPPIQGGDADSPFEDDDVNGGVKYEPIEATPYSLDDILKEGSFVDKSVLQSMLDSLKSKKNLILQGPPGTGKTWLAKKLAFALMGQRDYARIQAVQFHPNLAYEDFVRGWRPSGDGKLNLENGPFLEMIENSRNSPEQAYVVVIEEINRGNPAQIFGEMLTLLEADKRTPSEALALCHRKTSDERIYIPANLFVIGTMNIADRSLALVDLALRRRFSFFTLKPILGEPWRNWMTKYFTVFNEDILNRIEKSITALNEEISHDENLGYQFKIGHSYVTPPVSDQIADGASWFTQIVETEIAPLLEIYWLDEPETVKRLKAKLLEGF